MVGVRAGGQGPPPNRPPTEPEGPAERTVAMSLPADLVEAIDAEAARRVVGRKVLLPHLLRLGLEHLPPWPPEPPGPVHG